MKIILDKDLCDNNYTLVFYNLKIHLLISFLNFKIMCTVESHIHFTFHTGFITLFH
jgi:hypothetical protein